MKTAEMNHRFVTRNMVNQLAPVDTGINAVEVTWDAFQILMSNVFLLQKRTSPKNLPAKEFIRDAWATPKD